MNILFYIFVVLTIVGLDQYTKNLASIFIKGSEDINVINGFFRLSYAENQGAAFSTFQNQKIILIGLPIITILIIGFFLIKNKNKSKLETISLLFIIGGGIGNLIDRIMNGYVIDFLDFNFGTYHYPTFNIADTFATVGVILLCIYFIFFDKKNNEKNKDKN